MNKVAAGYIAMSLMVTSSVAVSAVASYELGQPAYPTIKTAAMGEAENGKIAKSPSDKHKKAKKKAKKSGAIKTKKAKRPAATGRKVVPAAVGTIVSGDIDVSQLEDGTFTGSAEGFNGPVEVSLTIEDGKIVDLKVTSQNETPEYYAMAKAVIQRILNAQSPDVDSVSGATITSNAIKVATVRALAQAGKNVEDEIELITASESKAAKEKAKKTAGKEEGEEPKEPGKDKPLASGKFRGSAVGFEGPVTVEVTVENGKMTDIKVVSHTDTPSYFASAKAVINRMLKSQSVSVDTVSGATISSRAIKLAVSRALQEAAAKGGNISKDLANSSTEFIDSKPSENGGFIALPAPIEEVSGPTSGTAFKDGIYRGEASGYNSVSNIVVDVKIEGGRMTAIKVVSSNDDQPYWDNALSIIKRLIGTEDVENVDTVSGATYSSRGIKNAVKRALKKAADAKVQEAVDGPVTEGVVVTKVDDSKLSEALTAKQEETLEAMKRESYVKLLCFTVTFGKEDAPETFAYKVPLENKHLKSIVALKEDGTKVEIPKDHIAIGQYGDGEKYARIETKDINTIVVVYDDKATPGEGSGHEDGAGKPTTSTYVADIVGTYNNPLFVRPPELDAPLHDGYYVGHGKGYYGGFTNSYIRQTKVGIKIENGKVAKVEEVDFGDDRTGGGPGFKFKTKKFVEKAFDLVKTNTNQFIKNHLDFERYITGRWLNSYEVPGITHFPQDDDEAIDTTLKDKVKAMDGLTGATMSNSGYSRAIAEALYKASKGGKQINDMYLEDHSFDRILNLDLPADGFPYDKITYYALKPDARREFRSERGYGRVVYYTNETFDPAGFVLTVEYSDGTKEQIPFEQLEEKGFRARIWYQDTKEFEPLRKGVQIRKIPYDTLLYIDRADSDPNIKSNFVNHRIYVFQKKK